jgi:hypothetical protein
MYARKKMHSSFNVAANAQKTSLITTAAVGTVNFA